MAKAVVAAAQGLVKGLFEGRSDAGAVVVPTLRPPQARILLMGALAAGASVEDTFTRWG